MAQFYALEVAGLGTTPVTNSNGAVQGGRIRRFRATITLASQAIDDTVVLAQVPAGYAFAYGIVNASATLGSSTIAIGIAGTPAKYRTAAVFTAAAPTLFGLVAAVDDAPLTAQETVILTNTTAALPASGTLSVDLYFSAP
jgi:phosphoserine aminotransferase